MLKKPVQAEAIEELNQPPMQVVNVVMQVSRQ